MAGPEPLARTFDRGGRHHARLAAKIVSADVRRARHIRSAFGRGRSERPINAIDPAPVTGHHRLCLHLSVIDNAANRAPERARTNGDNALDGRTRSAFWAAPRPHSEQLTRVRTSRLLTGLKRAIRKLAFGSTEGTARFD
jgi:hypothetical protein